MAKIKKNNYKSEVFVQGSDGRYCQWLFTNFPTIERKFMIITGRSFSSEQENYKKSNIRG
ncbi:MAG: hypothetical protein JXR95_04075 [Deltaproteobacteria bacterium]|nr:hypothetical protein [Deltaproteobacteria bacterium]